LARPQARAKHITALSNVQLLIAQSIEAELTVTETQLAAFEEKINAIVRRSELAPYLMSIPGAGPAMTAAFLAYVGDGSRFSKASEVANYVGLVPVLDCSGNTSHYGSISKVGCGALRSIVLQAAWSVVKCKEGGRLKAKYVSLCTRMTKTKSATALARKIMILMWTLVRRREFYADASIAGLKRKFRGYHLDFSGWEDRAS
jgi:transposase